jgi:hypothetical protein
MLAPQHPDPVLHRPHSHEEHALPEHPFEGPDVL